MRFLSRFFTPILLLGAAAYVWWNNQQDGEIIALFFLGDIFPTIAHNPRELGKLTVGILGAVGGLTLFNSMMRWQRRFKPPPE